ncbi:MAG: hypothetical protein A2747_02105 [Candidatus Yonathbacteria bacterium RIFCSPHIGHO2_01_FULL_44_41]|uniref:Glycosyltransferase 2-like domain-containing protein n=1 Tax=Candidatus Yonathbacteria bacterium RIFCSPHIGHO2_02_FULL_44_14 TaxID=1802724 RepID=A0A1G2S998_9BACT|nr:MAG: hypothetical protein A2747_02105 [Candidatus Yonathbacteria bacterium RIFCSPHIGHO2_01_FULL_44_41]OHA81654.1 MAG: hypothetical protein A3D51_02680 [Candidatus Yonathbacteria bacterium RIFCSPHIGHO2_02_FULL_44_14]OHA81835.1 MAG: hypothetical protein A3B06_02615 [Candidatus Yonathbacteria bacterium RIFCSPLOWO2_01_FULL_43_20]
MEKIISVIIPAYNESAGIRRVIKIIRSSPIVREIIVVDDGSSDNTSAIAIRSGAQVITLPRNRGKGQAMQAGVNEAKNDVILFCDGDMYGFSETSIKNMVSPIIEGKEDMVIGIRPVISSIQRIFPFLVPISGFRAIKKSLWSEIPSKFISGYQVELAINFVARRNGWRVLHFDVPGLKHSIKEAKLGIFSGLVARATMSFDALLFFLDLYLLKRAESNAALKKAKAYERVRLQK